MKSFVNVTGIIEEIASVLEKAEEQKLYDDIFEDEWIDPLQKITDIVRRYEMDLKLDRMDEANANILNAL